MWSNYKQGTQSIMVGEPSGGGMRSCRSSSEEKLGQKGSWLRTGNLYSYNPVAASQTPTPCPKGSETPAGSEASNHMRLWDTLHIHSHNRGPEHGRPHQSQHMLR